MVALLAPVVETVETRHTNGFNVDWILSCQLDGLTGLQFLRNASSGYFQAAAIDVHERTATVRVRVNAVGALFEQGQSSVGRVDFDCVSGR